MVYITRVFKTEIFCRPKELLNLYKMRLQGHLESLNLSF